jgi:hypothetical protein
MSNNNEMDDMNMDSEEDLNRNSFPEEDSCWENFEYIDTFLPRNIDF